MASVVPQHNAFSSYSILVVGKQNDRGSRGSRSYGNIFLPSVIPDSQGKKAPSFAEVKLSHDLYAFLCTSRSPCWRQSNTEIVWKALCKLH